MSAARHPLSGQEADLRRRPSASPHAAPAPVAFDRSPREGLDRGHEQAKRGSIVPAEPDLDILLRLDAHAPRAARSYVSVVDRPSPDLRDAVMLITSELVTRALRQDQFTSGADIELRVWMPAEIVRVELRGPRSALPPPSLSGEPHAELLIERLADRWSIDTHERDACAWFEIDRHEPHAVPPSDEVSRN
jgi:hypothetical protein